MDFGLAISAAVGAVFAILTSAAERLISRLFDRAAKREAQKESDIAILERVVFEVRDLSVIYWSSRESEAFSHASAGSIIGRLSFIAALSDSIFKKNVPLLRQMDVAINSFDVACTSGTFGSQRRQPEPERCRDIEIKAYSLFHLAITLQREVK